MVQYGSPITVNAAGLLVPLYSIPYDGGGNINILPQSRYRITGSAALAADNEFVMFAGQPTPLGLTYIFDYEATCTNAGGSVVILGRTLTNIELAHPQVITCIYDGSAWGVNVTTPNVVGGFDGQFIAPNSIPNTAIPAGSIDTTQLANQAVTFTKIQNLPAYTIPANNTGVAGSMVALTVSQFLTLIGWGMPPDLQYAVTTIASADVLTLSTIPVELVPAPGAGKAIQVVSASASMVYGTVPYATNGTLYLMTDATTATAPQFAVSQNSFLFGTVTRAVNFIPLSVSPLAVTDLQIVDNKPLEAWVFFGNPTAGDSDITINVVYKIIDVY